MKILPIKKKLKLYGFNNLTKTLSFNFYDISYGKKPEQSREYIEYIDDEYNAQRLTNILADVAGIIGASILNIASQDYDPQGASVTMLIAESIDNIPPECFGLSDSLRKEDVVGHLDKSHITVHTYPEIHPSKGISTFRADIDVSTCGQISPLRALNYLIRSFEPDMAIIDYRVRGFTRDIKGKKCFIDHKINSIQNFITKKIKNHYQMVDTNIYQENVFQTKMILREFDLGNYLFGVDEKDLLPNEKKKIKQKIQKEMIEIFSGQNITNIKLKKKKKKDKISETELVTSYDFSEYENGDCEGVDTTEGE